MLPKPCLTRLLGAALLLPVAMVVLAAFGQLLKALGDGTGAAVLMRLVLAGGVLWVLALIGLLLAMAARQMCEQHSADCPHDAEEE